jgi:uncharacterized protein with PIN domain
MKFVCDVMLGKLAGYLRILGLDTAYITDIDQLNCYKSDSEKPVFFTRRTPEKVPYDKCISIKSELVNEQLREIRDTIKPFINMDMLMSRCIRCNTTLSDAKKAEIEQFVPEYVLHRHDRFKTCPSCRKVYWQGSHTEHMMGWIEAFMAEVKEKGGKARG